MRPFRRIENAGASCAGGDKSADPAPIAAAIDKKAATTPSTIQAVGQDADPKARVNRNSNDQCIFNINNNNKD